MKIFINLLSMIVSILPLLLVIGLVILVFYLWKMKIKIKFRTFRGKGFRPVRGNFGLYVYNGKQGKGKTYSMVEYLLDNKNNIAVFCNIADIRGLDYFYFTGFKELLFLKKILDYNTDDYDQLVEYSNSLGFTLIRSKEIVDIIRESREKGKQLVFIYDEVFTELIKGSKLGKEVIDFLCQMRKRKIIFLTTCQEWAELPLSFRRFCRYEIDCDMFPFLWTGFLIKTFKDAENMKWSNEDQEHIAPLIETTITKCRKRIADSYDTRLRISSVVVPSVAEASATPQQDTKDDNQDDVNRVNGISQDVVENMPDYVIDINN